MIIHHYYVIRRSAIVLVTLGIVPASVLNLLKRFIPIKSFVYILNATHFK